MCITNNFTPCPSVTTLLPVSAVQTAVPPGGQWSEDPDGQQWDGKWGDAQDLATSNQEFYIYITHLYQKGLSPFCAKYLFSFRNFSCDLQ